MGIINSNYKVDNLYDTSGPRKEELIASRIDLGIGGLELVVECEKIKPKADDQVPRSQVGNLRFVSLQRKEDMTREELLIASYQDGRVELQGDVNSQLTQLCIYLSGMIEEARLMDARVQDSGGSSQGFDRWYVPLLRVPDEFNTQLLALTER